MKLYNIQRTETKGKIPRGELKRRFSRLLQFFFWARRFLPVGTSGEEISRRRIFCSEGNGILSVKLKLWFDIQSNVVGPAVQGRSQDHCSLSIYQSRRTLRRGGWCLFGGASVVGVVNQLTSESQESPS